MIPKDHYQLIVGVDIGIHNLDSMSIIHTCPPFSMLLFISFSSLEIKMDLRRIMDTCSGVKEIENLIKVTNPRNIFF
jgi:hypothetical protein